MDAARLVAVLRRLTQRLRGERESGKIGASVRIYQYPFLRGQVPRLAIQNLPSPSKLCIPGRSQIVTRSKLRLYYSIKRLGGMDYLEIPST